MVSFSEILLKETHCRFLPANVVFKSSNVTSEIGEREEEEEEAEEEEAEEEEAEDEEDDFLLIISNEMDEGEIT